MGRLYGEVDQLFKDLRSDDGMHYDQEGRLLGCEVTDDPVVVQRSCFWRDAAWHHAIPVRDYLAMRPGILERA